MNNIYKNKTRKNKTCKNKTQKNKTQKNKTCKISNIPSLDKDITAVIDIKAIRNNVRVLKNATGTDIMPVLKADAYGHGLVEMAKILRKIGIKYLGVATIGEAILLRKSGDKGRILAWLYDIDGNEFKDSLGLNLDIAIFDEKLIPKIKDMIPSGIKLKVTMFVDTGINRAGISYNNAIQAFKDIVSCDKFELIGMMSHLVCSQIKNSPIVNEQLRKFRELRKNLQDIGIKPPLVHIANTGACLNYDVSDFTLSRSGAGIYGIFENDKLKPIMTLKTYIIQLKDVNKGEGIGYNWKYIAKKNTKVAVLPLGYADVIPRISSGKLFVYVNGTKRKVFGTISMDQIIIESKERDKINDDVILFGNGVNCPQTALKLSKYCDTIPEEILCRIGYRVNRIYVNK
jgi:alanine racemase